MANDVTTRASAGALAAAQALRANLAAVSAPLPSGAKGFVKFLQDGSWVFGQDNTELAKGTEVAINPLSVKSGYSSWTDYDKKDKKKNELVGEFLVPLGAPLPPKHTMKDTGWDWRDLRVVEMKVLTGPHKGTELVYSTTSDGGLRMLKAVLDQVILQIDEDPEHIVPVVALDNDHYMHKQWGKTYTPVMEIVEFIGMNGPEEVGEEAELDDTPDPAPEPEPTKAAEPETTARRRRR